MNACTKQYSNKVLSMKHLFFILAFSFLQVLYSLAQSDIVLQLYDAEGNYPIEASWTSMDNETRISGPHSESIRVTFSSKSKPIAINFAERITSFSIAEFAFLGENPSLGGSASFGVAGYGFSGQRVTPYSFTTSGQVKDAKLSLDELSHRPLFSFPEEVHKVVIEPSGLETGTFVQFSIEGVSSRGLLYPNNDNWAGNCSLDEVYIVLDCSGSVSVAENKAYRQKVWEQLPALADKSLSLSIIEFGERAETKFYTRELRAKDIEVGTKLYKSLFPSDVNKTLSPKKSKMEEMTNLQSVLEHINESGSKQKAVMICTDNLPNFTPSGTYLPTVAGAHNLLSSIWALAAPVRIITDNGHLLGVSDLLESKLDYRLCTPVAEANFPLLGRPCPQDKKAMPVFNVFPNPSSGDFTIECSDCTEEKPGQAVLKDVAGRAILGAVALNRQYTNIKADKLAAGSYFVWIRSADQSLEPVPLIIAR